MKKVKETADGAKEISEGIAKVEKINETIKDTKDSGILLGQGIKELNEYFSNGEKGCPLEAIDIMVF